MLLIKRCLRNLDLNTSDEYPVMMEALSFRGTDTLVTLRAEDGTLWKKTCIGSVPWQLGDRIKARLKIQEPVLFPENCINRCDKWGMVH